MNFHYRSKQAYRSKWASNTAFLASGALNVCLSLSLYICFNMIKRIYSSISGGDSLNSLAINTCWDPVCDAWSILGDLML